MRRTWFVLFFTMVLFASCRKENNTPDNANTNFNPGSGDSLLAEGNFISQVHSTSGTVKVYRNTQEQTLVFTNFKTDNGPDLRVYLSKDLSNQDFVELGTLKAVSGNFQYTFSNQTDIQAYNRVLIWCQDFSVLFGSAELN